MSPRDTRVACSSRKSKRVTLWIPPACRSFVRPSPVKFLKYLATRSLISIRSAARSTRHLAHAWLSPAPLADRTGRNGQIERYTAVPYGPPVSCADRQIYGYYTATILLKLLLQYSGSKSKPRAQGSKTPGPTPSGAQHE